MKKINSIRELVIYLFMIDNENEYISIENILDDTICPICLDISGELIQTGCDICKDNNKWIHRDCLYELQQKHYHINRCYICKSPLENVPILYNHNLENNVIINYNEIIDNRRNRNNYYKNACAIFITITILGFVGKIILFIFFVTIDQKPDKILNIYNFSPMSIFLHFFIGTLLFMMRYYCYFYCWRGN